MRPNRILCCLLVTLLVALGLLAPDSEVVRAAPVPVKSDQPRIVSISPIGTISRRQTFQLLLNTQSGEAVLFGYFNYIHGLDEEKLYQGDSPNAESTALFTLHLVAKVIRFYQHGPLEVYEARGVSTVFYDDTPDGDFSKPETFKDGMPIAMGEENSVYTFDPDTGIGIGDVRLRQFQAWPFQFNGEFIQFGAVGNQNVAWRGKSLWYDWLNLFGYRRAYCTSTTIQAEPLPAAPPP